MYSHIFLLFFLFYGGEFSWISDSVKNKLPKRELNGSFFVLYFGKDFFYDEIKLQNVFIVVMFSEYKILF